MDNTLLYLHYSSYHTKAEFDNYFIVHLNISQFLTSLSQYKVSSEHLLVPWQFWSANVGTVPFIK